MKIDLIHLRIPGPTKGRWVRASRAAGMRLTEWVVNRVEESMREQMKASIPDDLQFTDLQLTRDSNGFVRFEWRVIERICQVSALPVEVFRDAPEDIVAGLIVSWYQAHRQSGGALDLVAEELIGEVLTEDAAGQHASHQPGRG